MFIKIDNQLSIYLYNLCIDLLSKMVYNIIKK